MESFAGRNKRMYLTIGSADMSMTDIPIRFFFLILNLSFLTITKIKDQTFSRSLWDQTRYCLCKIKSNQTAEKTE